MYKNSGRHYHQKTEPTRMQEQEKNIRISKYLKDLNVQLSTAVEVLAAKKMPMDNNPNAKISQQQLDVLFAEFQHDRELKESANQISAVIGKARKDREDDHDTVTKPAVKEAVTETTSAPIPVAVAPEVVVPVIVEVPVVVKAAPVVEAPKPVVEAIVETKPEPVIIPEPKAEVKEVAPEPTVIEPTASISDTTEKASNEPANSGLKVLGKIDLSGTKSRQDDRNKYKTEIKQGNKGTNTAPVKPNVDTKPATPEPVRPAASTPNTSVVAPKATITPAEPILPPEIIRAKADTLRGAVVLGKIVLPVEKTGNNAGGFKKDENGKRKRRDKSKGVQVRPDQVGRDAAARGPNDNNRGPNDNRGRTGNNGPARPTKEAPTDKEVQDQIKNTLQRLQTAGKPSKFAQGAKFRRAKRDRVAEQAEEKAANQELENKILKVTEFVTANELAKMMDVAVTQVISTCMSLGMFVSINQRLDAETLSIVAEEFGFETEFVTVDIQEAVEEEIDAPEDLVERAPIITVMGHVDHGKTSLLDHIRSANVISGEAGGITQHIGAYEVILANNKRIAFLDTPGHEAFTAMRARGAKITDIVIIVIAADDNVMPQTKEAINHAQAAGVPMVFAINKIDKAGANPDRIKEELSAMNILVEEWGGKFQCQEISAKKGLGIEELLEKVLLEAELLELKANPNKRANATVIEATMDKGKGIVTTIMVQSGTLRVGDPMVAGCFYGKVKALENERGQRVKQAGPSTPVRVLGMNGAPQAGDKIAVMENEQEAKDIATKRSQLQREQSLRTQRHITLDEIGRRLAIGNFKELKLIIKGDVDGSVEALSDSLLKLSTPEVQIVILHKSVGQISESDVLLASASDAIIIGFQVRPSANARKLAEQEQIDIRQYSIIYAAIDEIKQAMEGMLAPTIEEKVTGNIEIREVYDITKVGKIAGCYVLDGKVFRNSNIRIIRDGVVIHTGKLASLKRFKDDVKEVNFGYECGLNIEKFNNIEIGDVIEAYEEVEVKRKLTA